MFDLENLWFLKPNHFRKKLYEKEVYFKVFNDLLYLMKDMDLSPTDLDKIIKYFEEKIND